MTVSLSLDSSVIFSIGQFELSNIRVIIFSSFSLFNRSSMTSLLSESDPKPNFFSSIFSSYAKYSLISVLSTECLIIFLASGINILMFSSLAFFRVLNWSNVIDS